jgi:CBS domain-containing protein
MTKDPVTIAPHLPLDVALETMRANSIRRLPVVADTGRVIGIITLYDALLATRTGESWLGEVVSEMPLVKDAMTANVHTIGPDETVGRAASQMNTFRVGALPVVENMRLIGIITESDLFRILAEMQPEG